MTKNYFAMFVLASVTLMPLLAAENDPLEELRKEKAAKQNSPLIQESQKQHRKPKKNVIYQWVDENGKTVISDVPHEGAIEIKLPQPQTYNAPKIKPKAQLDNEQSQPKIFEKISNVPPKLKIISPVNESWLDNNQGNLQVSVSVTPNLGPGQSLVIKLDDQEVSRGLVNLVNLQGLDRGNHSLTVEVQITKTHKIIASEQVSFNVRRPTVKR